jgi:hypothetical protein
LRFQAESQIISAACGPPGSSVHCPVSHGIGFPAFTHALKRPTVDSLPSR